MRASFPAAQWQRPALSEHRVHEESLLDPFSSADTLFSPGIMCTRPTRHARQEQTRTQTEPKKDDMGSGPARGAWGRRQGRGLRVQAVCSQEAGARLQGPLRRLLPLIWPPLAPKNNILVCLLGALRDRDRLFIPAISMRPYSRRPVLGRRLVLAAPAAGDCPETLLIPAVHLVAPAPAPP